MGGCLLFSAFSTPSSFPKHVNFPKSATYILSPPTRTRRRVSLGISQKKKRRGAAIQFSAQDPDSKGIQLYGQIERLMTKTARLSQDSWGNTGNWEEIEGAWVLKPTQINPIAVVHFIGGIFVGAAPQITYRMFLESLSMRGFVVVATPYSSGFDYFRIADESQFKFDRCFRVQLEDVCDLPIFGIGHSLGSVIHLLIGARYAVQRAGNVLMSFNNKDASEAIPLFSPVIVPVAQSFGPIISQLISSPTLLRSTEVALKQLEMLNPPLLKQILPLIEQLPPLYMELMSGKEDFVPHPSETRRLIRSYYGVRRNLLLKFKDDIIDETPVLAQILSSDSAIASCLDMSVRTVPGDHGLPLQQVLPDVPTSVVDAVTKGGEMISNITSGTPWETVAKEVSMSLGLDSNSPALRQSITKDVDQLVDEIVVWVMSTQKFLPQGNK